MPRKAYRPRISEYRPLGMATPRNQQVDADPPAGTEHHDAAGTEHFGEHAGAPAAEGREQAVHSDQQGGLRGREALVDHEFGEEGELESVAGHEDGNGKEAKQQHTGNTEFFKKANHGLTPSTSLSVEVVQGKMRPPEEKGKAGGQAILAAKTVRRNLFLPLAGGGAQHRRVVIHAAGCLPSVGSAASSPQGEEPAKCRNYSPTLTTALETPGSCRRGSPGLLRVPVRADERCDVHLAGFEQADGVFEGERLMKEP